MKIRIAVAVAKDGTWRACGWRDPNETIFGLHDQMMDNAIEFLSEHVHEQGMQYHTVWVEVDVPLPAEPVTVIGRVVGEE